MAKLYFRWGTVSSGKTARLAIDVYNDRLSGRNVLVLKVALDTRSATIASRIPGLELAADATIEFPGDIISAIRARGPVDFIYVDEIQFASRDVVEMLRDVAASGTPVICYGLNTDWRLQLFEGSAAMFALADSIENIKSICAAWDEQCPRRALVNVKHCARQPVSTDAPQIDVGAEEKYIGMCYRHYCEFLKKRND